MMFSRVKLYKMLDYATDKPSDEHQDYRLRGRRHGGCTEAKIYMQGSMNLPTHVLR